MKMMYGGVPIKSLNIKHYEMDTNSATVQPSDLQAGVTCFARGQKLTGTGRSFEFASYGDFETNDEWLIPAETINVVHLSSAVYPTTTLVSVTGTNELDFSTPQTIGTIVVDGNEYPINVQAKDYNLVISCEQQVTLQVFYGKDNYI